MSISGVKLFENGQILSANDLNQYLMRGVKVFADTSTRDAAYGGAGEPSLEEGEFAYTTNSNTLWYYDGSGWQSAAEVTQQLGLNAQTGTTYTVAVADAGRFVTLNNASPIALTVPLNSTAPFNVGTQVNLMQLGAGQVTVAGAGGVTVRSQGSKLKSNGQYSVMTLLKIGTDEWVLIGNTAA